MYYINININYQAKYTNIILQYIVYNRCYLLGICKNSCAYFQCLIGKRRESNIRFDISSEKKGQSNIQLKDD